MATRFELHIRRQVLQFLETVIIVDDEAFRPVARSQHYGADSWEEDTSSVGPELSLETPDPKNESDALDALAVSRTFADHQLCCAILSPQSVEENNDLRSAFIKTARRADALILDWNLNGDNGVATEKLVRGVLQEDAKSTRRRLRLILIYTGEPDLLQIADRIRRITDNIQGQTEAEWDEGSRTSFSNGPTRVAVFAKEHVQNLPSDLINRRRKVGDLPNTVVDEFSRHSLGLVTTACISALAGIRDDAHRVLAALGPEIDGAVLGQRVLLSNPQDVERQVEALISSELSAIVQDHEVGSHVGLKRIAEWIKHTQIGDRGVSSIGGMTSELRLRLLTEGLSKSVAETLKDKGIGQKSILREATHLFSSSLDQSRYSDQLFSMRMSVRNRYARPAPILQLGTIVERDGKYAICVQPLCDSVRIKDSMCFPLLPLKEANGESGPGDLTLIDPRSPGVFLRLRATPKPSEIMMRTFKANSSEVVQVKWHRGVGRFHEVREKGRARASWRWVADLKADHAQRVVERLSTEFSRVGLEEAEILRRSRP